MRYGLEALVLLAVLLIYARSPLLNLDPTLLQQTGEQNEAATLLVVTEQALKAGVVPLWNPYMSSGFPVAGDFVSTFWNPVVTIPVALFGGVNGFKVSAFLSLLVAGLGQLALGRVLGVRWMFRLWSATLLMLSGGLALFWRLGWHQLLAGLVWFPFSFAALIWALRARRWWPSALAALPIFLVFSSAGGYYFLYLGVALVVVTLLMLLTAPASERVGMLGRAVLVALLAVMLSAVVLVPGIDVYRFTARESLGDPNQQDSQPIVYALMNYLVYEPQWFNSNLLGQLLGYTWFYVGALPFIGILGLPFAANRTRRRREALVLGIGLLALFLIWHANRHTFVRQIYDAFPLLYQFRFNGRLLAVGTIPLLILGALGLQGLLDALLRAFGRRADGSGRTTSESASLPATFLRWGTSLLMIATLLLSVQNVLQVNRPFAFATNQARDVRPVQALEWLHQYDPGLYNIQAGDWRIWWAWTTPAYEVGQPVLNFAYNRHTRSFLRQREGGVVVATPRYIIPWGDSVPTTLPQVGTAGGYPVYEVPDALPYAFTASSRLLAGSTPLVRSQVAEVNARWLNPNQLGVRVEGGQDGDQLIVLVSDFPGWRVYVDGRRAELRTVNEYLGTPVVAGDHTYLFSFEPPKATIGLILSGLTLLVILSWLLTELIAPWWNRRSGRQRMMR